MAGSKKGQQSAHNKAVGKYTRQRPRTEANKRKRKQIQENIRKTGHKKGEK